VFYDADAWKVSGMPTWRALGSPQGPHVMIPTPSQPHKRYGLGSVNSYTGETVVLFRRRKRSREVAERSQTLRDKHPTGTIIVVWDHEDTHGGDTVDVVGRAAAGQLVRLYLPTSSPWLNPSERLWRHFRREATHWELFITLEALL
jgi:putative transposase